MSAAALMLLLGLSSNGEPRRFVIAIGDNGGDPTDQDLRFAEADAEAFVDTLEQVGGVRPADAVLMRGATAVEVLQALADVGQRLSANAPESNQLILYVSSHADEGELHLAGTRLSLSELNEQLKIVPATVVVAVVDSCRSGALTRLKGLTPIPGFDIDIRSPDVRGRVIITSSGADEYSQESPTYRGSYFTHHFISALRGAADLRHDGLVTLQEAYTYAYEQTVNTTFATRGGTQHPSYAENLQGEGALVLSDLHTARGRLVLDLHAPGHWQVTRKRDDVVVAEFLKPEGRAQFALAPGVYAVRERAGDLLREAVANVPQGGEAVVTDHDLDSTLVASAELKGGNDDRPSEIGLMASIGDAAVGGLPPLAGVTVVFRRDLARPWWGLVNSLMASSSFTAGASSTPVDITELELTLQAGPAHEWSLQSYRLRAGVEAGATVVGQLGGSGSPIGGDVGVSPFLVARVEGELQLSARWGILLSGMVGPSIVEKQDGWWIEPKLGLGAGVAYAY